MRASPFFVLGALAMLAGCGPATTTQVNSAPPTVSYQVVGSDLTQANNEAGRYCGQYGMAAQLYGTQPSGNGSVASYGCVTGSSGQVYGANTTYPSPGYTAYPGQPYGSATPVATSPPGYSATTVQCADTLHQNRPGGSDYSGPPVPGCPQQ